MKKALFLHGLSSDGSVTSSFLRKLGYDVHTPKLSDWFFSRAVAQAQDAFDSFQPNVIVGSSRGGAVAMNIDSGDTPLILLAPAWRRWGKIDRITKPSFVIHSMQDNVVPYDDSVKLWTNSTGLELICAGADHRLNDAEAKGILMFALGQVTG